MPGKTRLGLQVSIVLVIAFVVTCLTVGTASSIFLASTQAAREAAGRLFSEITARVSDRVSDQMAGLLDRAGLGAAMPGIEAPIRGAGLDHPVLGVLRRALAQDAGLYSAYVAHPDGSFLQVIAARNDPRILAFTQAPPDTWTIVRAIAAEQGGQRRETWTFLSRDGVSCGSAIVRPDPTYDPRSRGWYKAAMAGADSTLSEPYVFASLPEPGITVSHRADVAGVVFAIDMTLRGLAEFVAGQSVSPHGGVILFDQERRVLALSPALAPSDGTSLAPLAPLASIGRPLLAPLSAIEPGRGVVRLPTAEGDALVELTATRGTDGQQLMVALVAPFADFTGPIDDMQARILYVALLVLLGVVPLSMLWARNIARAVISLVHEARRVESLDFSGPPPPGSFISEFHALSRAFGLMKSTLARRTTDLANTRVLLERLVDLGIAMSAERDTARLMDMILMGAKELSNADGGTLYIRDGEVLHFQILRNSSLDIRMGGSGEPSPSLPPVPLTLDDGTGNHANVASHAVIEQTTINIADAYNDQTFDFTGTHSFDQRTGYRSVSFLTVPLKPRGGQVIGALQLINAQDADGAVVPFSASLARFVEALAAQAATALYNRELLDSQDRLMDALIRIMAGAIDAKSAYTGAHCARVPELALMLAEEASRTQDGPLAAFAFTTPDQWREFRIGAWLHDCGKVTTPEFVVDKATKLETIHNRIHEVRTRFEVLLRDARIRMLEAVAAGTPQGEAARDFAAEEARLHEDFAFIAECNIGSEFMAPDTVDHLKTIATRTWQRHFDDRLGLSHEELRRVQTEPPEPLPATEPLLSDKPHQVIPRPTGGNAQDPTQDFQAVAPVNLYNFGEIYNLSISRGTLNEEERFKINEHIIQTILMLERLPFPRHLSRVAEYAGTHHETLSGTGYPRRLGADALSVPARIMAIADIFEALTASDRPYKKAKTLSEAVRILSDFKARGHIDPDLFDLFLTSGVHRRYGERFLAPDQIDEVDITPYLGPRAT